MFNVTTFPRIASEFKFYVGTNPPRTATGMAHVQKKMRDEGDLDGPVPVYMAREAQLRNGQGNGLVI